MKNCEIKYKQIFDQCRYSGLLQLADAKIQTNDGCSFDVHRVMLATCSEFFRAMFCGLNKDKKIHVISSIDGDCLSDILVFIYTENISVNEENIEKLLIAAHSLSLRHLYAKIKSNVESAVTNANCLRLCLLTHQLNYKEIFRCCLNFIISRFDEIVDNQKSGFNDFPLDLLKRILCNRNLYFKNESEIWQVIVQWVQAMPQTRLEHVGDLLSTLVMGKIHAHLGRKILNHDIIHNNVHMKALNDTIPLIDIDRAGDVITDFLKDFKPNNFSIPEKLTFFSDTGTNMLKFFISLDETVDLWFKVAEIPSFRSENLMIVKSKVYFFERDMKHKCLIFDLETFKQKQVQNIHNIPPLIAVENTFYTIVWGNKRFYINEYDVEKEESLPISSLDDFNIHVIAATAIGQDIFIVATSEWENRRNIFTWMFNVVTRKWINVSSPTKFHTLYKLVSFHNKICLIDTGCERPCTPEVEVFDPAVNIWKVLPDLHKTYYHADLIIFNDKLVVYDRDNRSIAGNAELWNDNKECWEVLEKTASYGKTDFRWYLSCTINNTELIKIITNKIRNFKVKMEEIRFLL